MNHPVLGRDITALVRTLERELYRRPVVGMDELLPTFIGSIERSGLKAVHDLELRRPAVFALASADEPIECHRACHLLRKVEHFLSRVQLSLDALAPGTELGEQQAESDEDEERERIVRRELERMHRRDEPIQSSCCADQRSEQAGSASAIPGTQDHCRDGKLIDGGALQEGKCAAEQQRKAGQHEGKAIALEHIWHLSRQVHRETGAGPPRRSSISSWGRSANSLWRVLSLLRWALPGRHRSRATNVRKRRFGFRFVLQGLALHDSPLACAATLGSEARFWRGAQVELAAYLLPQCRSLFGGESDARNL